MGIKGFPSKESGRKEELEKKTKDENGEIESAKKYEMKGDKTGQHQKPSKKANPSADDIISGIADVPAKKGGFDGWFDDLTVEEINKLAKDKNISNTIKKSLRDGNNHEWFKVSQFVKLKEWGVTSEEIKYLGVTQINTDEDDDLWFVNIEVPKDKQKGKLKGKEFIDGRHTDGKRKDKSTHGEYEGSAASYAHLELDRLIEESNSKEEYIEKLNEWADKHLLKTKKDSSGKDENGKFEDETEKEREALPPYLQLPRKEEGKK